MIAASQAQFFQKIVSSAQDSNGRSRDQWAAYAEHRSHLMEVIKTHERGGKIVVVGAGNGNDIEINELISLFSEVHLVDLDQVALSRALARMRRDSGTPTRVVCHAPVDASGLDLKTARGSKVNQSASIPPCDVVVSTCVLTQVARAISEMYGASAVRADALKSLVLDSHLSFLTRLAVPGGRIILITDIVSSDTFPLEEVFHEGSADQLPIQLSRAGNVYASADPVKIKAWLRHQSTAMNCDDIRTFTPWLWRALPERTYLVCGYSWRSRAGKRRPVAAP